MGWSGCRVGWGEVGWSGVGLGWGVGGWGGGEQNIRVRGSGLTSRQIMPLGKL